MKKLGVIWRNVGRSHASVEWRVLCLRERIQSMKACNSFFLIKLIGSNRSLQTSKQVIWMKLVHQRSEHEYIKHMHLFL